MTRHWTDCVTHARALSACDCGGAPNRRHAGRRVKQGLQFKTFGPDGVLTSAVYLREGGASVEQRVAKERRK